MESQNSSCIKYTSEPNEVEKRQIKELIIKTKESAKDAWRVPQSTWQLNEGRPKNDKFKFLEFNDWKPNRWLESVQTPSTKIVQPQTQFLAQNQPQKFMNYSAPSMDYQNYQNPIFPPTQIFNQNRNNAFASLQPSWINQHLRRFQPVQNGNLTSRPIENDARVFGNVYSSAGGNLNQNGWHGNSNQVENLRIKQKTFDPWFFKKE